MRFDWALYIPGGTFLTTEALYSVMQLSSSTCGMAVWSGPCFSQITTLLQSCCQGSRSDHILGCVVGMGSVEVFNDRQTSLFGDFNSTVSSYHRSFTIVLYTYFVLNLAMRQF
jgi:hypothetical protein